MVNDLGILHEKGHSLLTVIFNAHLVQVCNILGSFSQLLFAMSLPMAPILLSVRPVKNNPFEGVSNSGLKVVPIHLVKGNSECLLIGI